MAFRVTIHPSVIRKMRDWQLPDFLLVDIYLHLREELSENPARVLVRAEEPFDGMNYGFRVIDPGNRLCEHACVFQIVYSQDEESLIAVRLHYLRQAG